MFCTFTYGVRTYFIGTTTNVQKLAKKTLHQNNWLDTRMFYKQGGGKKYILPCKFGWLTFGPNTLWPGTLCPAPFGQSHTLASHTLAKITLWPKKLWPKTLWPKSHFGQSRTLASHTLAKITLWPKTLWDSTLAGRGTPLNSHFINFLALEETFMHVQVLL